MCTYAGKQSSLHATVQRLDVARCKICPFSLDSCIKLSKCRKRIRARMNFVFYEAPNVFNRVQVCAVGRPIKGTNPIACLQLFNYVQGGRLAEIFGHMGRSCLSSFTSGRVAKLCFGCAPAPNQATLCQTVKPDKNLYSLIEKIFTA